MNLEVFSALYRVIITNLVSSGLTSKEEVMLTFRAPSSLILTLKSGEDILNSCLILFIILNISSKKVISVFKNQRV